VLNVRLRCRVGFALAGKLGPARDAIRMTREEQEKFIADYCDGFKKLLLAKIDRIPPYWDRAEIQQWIVCTARDACTVKMTPAREHKRMRRVCPACAKLGNKWVKAVEKREALDRSIADVSLIQAAYAEAYGAFMAYVLRRRNCTECVRREA
jgi:hypothetical protein